MWTGCVGGGWHVDWMCWGGWGGACGLDVLAGRDM